jgi:hypothetical protein
MSSKCSAKGHTQAAAKNHRVSQPLSRQHLLGFFLLAPSTALNANNIKEGDTDPQTVKRDAQ